MDNNSESTWGMEYNSNRELLRIPEYGRNVQKLINHAKTIEDKPTRQKFVEQIVRMMQQMHPQNGSVEDHRERLWKHVFHIADYDIDVNPPMETLPTREESLKKPEAIPYPQLEARFRHYGHNVQKLIKKAKELPEGSKQNGFIAAIGAYMKLAYKTWNKDYFINDETVKADLASLSDGDLAVSEQMDIDFLTSPNRRRGKRSSGSNQSNSGGRHHRNSRGGHRRKK